MASAQLLGLPLRSPQGPWLSPAPHSGGLKARPALLQGGARGGCCQGLLLGLCRRQGVPWHPGRQQSLSTGCCLQAIRRKHKQQSWLERLAGLQGIKAAGQPCSSCILQGPTAGTGMQAWLGPGGRLQRAKCKHQTAVLAWLAVIMEEGDNERGNALVAGSPQPVLAGVQHQQQSGHTHCCTGTAQLHDRSREQPVHLLLTLQPSQEGCIAPLSAQEHTHSAKLGADHPVHQLLHWQKRY